MREHFDATISFLAVSVFIVIVVLLLWANTTSSEQARETAKRWSQHVPNATGEIECADDFGDSSQYCNIFRTGDAPLSVRCDKRTCTTMPKPDSHTTIIHTGGK